MPTLHIFNPSHDEALAFGRADYCPSRAARRLGDVLADLPRWWAAEGDEVLRLPEAMGLDAVTPPDWRRIDRIEPWGWDAHIVGVLQRLSAPERLLPDALRLAHLRSLSSRQSTTRFLHAMNDEVLPVGVLKGNSWWCATFAEVKSALAHCSGEAMVKQPWSSSGRGVFPCNSDLPTPLLARIKKTIDRQGAVEVQPRYERLADGALEFQAQTDGRIVYLGPSLFATTAGGAYCGQRVAAPAALEHDFLTLWQRCCPHLIPTFDVAQRSFTALVALLEQQLSRLLQGRYEGPLGIDVLFTPAGLHPCIEINLRRTMGHVALAMAQRAAHLPALPTTFRIGEQGLVWGE